MGLPETLNVQSKPIKSSSDAEVLNAVITAENVHCVPCVVPVSGNSIV